MILSSEIGSHSFRLFPASLDKISATPFSRGALSSVTPEYSTVPSVASWTFSALLHLVSLTPRIARPNLFISLATWCAFHRGIAHSVILSGGPRCVLFKAIFPAKGCPLEKLWRGSQAAYSCLLQVFCAWIFFSYEKF